MARPVSTFVKSDLTVKDFALLLETRLQTKFVKNNHVEWELYESRFFGIFIQVYESEDFTDEPPLDFSNFSLVISMVCDSKSVTVEYKFEWPKVFSVVLFNLVLKDDVDKFMITDSVEALILRN